MTKADEYFRPERLEDALGYLVEARPTIAAGCTDLFPATARKFLPGPVLDITGIASLRGILEEADGVSIGGATTWAALIDAPLPPAFDGLKAAAREVGARQIQARGTLAGNLCNASPAADGVPVLLTLDAHVDLANAQGTRRLPLSEFLIGPRQTALQPGELVTRIFIPKSATQGRGVFLKLGARKYLVISIGMTAARIVIEDGIVTEAALAIGACSPVATRLPEAEAALIGARLDPARITPELISRHLSPISDARADAVYRIEVAAELLRRCVAPMVERQAA